MIGSFGSDFPSVTGRIHQGIGESRSHMSHISSPCQASHPHVYGGAPNVTGCIHQGIGDSQSRNSHVSSCQAVPTLGAPILTGRIHQGNGGAMSSTMTSTMYSGHGGDGNPNITGRIHQGIGGAESSMQSHPSAKLEHGMNKTESEKSLRLNPSDVTGRIHQGSGIQGSANVIRESVGNYMNISRPANYDEAFQTLQRNLTHDSTGRIHQGFVNENSMKDDLPRQGIVSPNITGRIHQGVRDGMTLNASGVNSNPNLTGRIHQGFGVEGSSNVQSHSHEVDMRSTSHVRAGTPILPVQACQHAGTSNVVLTGGIRSGTPQDPFHMNASEVQSGNANPVNNTPNRGSSGPPGQPPSPPPPGGNPGNGLQHDDDIRSSGNQSTNNRRPSGAGGGGSGPPGGDPPAAAGVTDPTDDGPVGGGSGYDFIGGRRVVVGNT